MIKLSSGWIRFPKNYVGKKFRHNTKPTGPRFDPLRVDFLLKTDSGYPRDAEVTLFTLANPEHSLRFNTHWSAPPVSALARSGGPRKMSHSPVPRNSNIERRMDRTCRSGGHQRISVNRRYSCLLWPDSGFDGVRYLRAIG